MTTPPPTPAVPSGSADIVLPLPLSEQHPDPTEPPDGTTPTPG
ncbi:hypothetical protein ACFVVA_28910 [Kitasatospora sp. NPDC058048]